MNEPQTDRPEPAPLPRLDDVPAGFLVGWTLFGLFAYLVIGGTLQFMHLTFGLWFSEVFLFAGVAVLGWQMLRWRPLAAMGLTRFDGRGLGLGVAFGLVNYLAWAVPSMALAQAIFPRSLVELFDASKVFDRQTTTELVLIVLAVSLAAPFGEEFFFRGFLQRGLQERTHAPRAIVLTAVIFSAFHLDPVGFVARFELGVLFGLLAWKSGSIWPAMGAHAANNAVSSLLFLVARGTEHQEDDLPWYVPVAMFVVGNLALYALVRFAAPRLATAQPSTLTPTETAPSPARAFAPWFGAGVASVLLLLAIDYRGVLLNVLDGISQLPAATLKRDDVKSLRVQVRQGDAPWQEYRDLLDAESAHVKR